MWNPQHSKSGLKPIGNITLLLNSFVLRSLHWRNNSDKLCRLPASAGALQGVRGQRGLLCLHPGQVRQGGGGDQGVRREGGGGRGAVQHPGAGRRGQGDGLPLQGELL